MAKMSQKKFFEILANKIDRRKWSVVCASIRYQNSVVFDGWLCPVTYVCWKKLGLDCGLNETCAGEELGLDPDFVDAVATAADDGDDLSDRKAQNLRKKLLQTIFGKLKGAKLAKAELRG